MGLQISGNDMDDSRASFTPEQPLARSEGDCWTVESEVLVEATVLAVASRRSVM